MTPEFTYEELARDILQEMGDMRQPMREEGWMTVRELADCADSLSPTQIRLRLERGIKKGFYERVDFKKSAYYRKKTAER